MADFGGRGRAPPQNSWRRHAQGKALDTLARGAWPQSQRLGSPSGAAISSFLAFSVGASLPIIPFLLGLSPAVPIAAAISGAALVRGRRRAQPVLG
ncbi:MAG: VIT1/CCC1 transporter family protein [Methyloceanibacter sp.]